MVEHKANMGITKTDKYKKRLKTTSVTEHSTDMNIIKIEKGKNWSWQNAKQKWTLLTLTNAKKLATNFTTEHKTEYN